jgi:predicted regulator of amino acid metabolism with ACT domain
MTEDPEFTDEPRLYVITDDPISGGLINDIRSLPFVERIELG